MPVQQVGLRALAYAGRTEENQSSRLIHAGHRVAGRGGTLQPSGAVMVGRSHPENLCGGDFPRRDANHITPPL